MSASLPSITDSLIESSSTEYRNEVFTDSSWEKISKGIDYSNDKEIVVKKQNRKKKEQETSSNLNLDFLKTGTAKIIFFSAIILILILITYAVIRNSNELKSDKINNHTIITEDNVDEHLVIADLDKMLADAIENSNYKLAIRIYFLMIIKTLNQNQIIEWQKEKTNKDYLIEMSAHPDYHIFRKLTNLFDKIWYGDTIINSNEYDRIKPYFIEFIDQLNSTSQTKIST